MIIPLWNDSNNKDGIKWLVTDTFPGGSDGKEWACNVETQVQPLGQEDPLEKGWQSTPVFLPGEFHGQRSLVGYSPWGSKETDTAERLIHTHTQRNTQSCNKHFLFLCSFISYISFKPQQTYKKCSQVNGIRVQLSRTIFMKQILHFLVLGLSQYDTVFEQGRKTIENVKCFGCWQRQTFKNHHLQRNALLSNCPV